MSGFPLKPLASTTCSASDGPEGSSALGVVEILLGPLPGGN